MAVEKVLEEVVFWSELYQEHLYIHKQDPPERLKWCLYQSVIKLHVELSVELDEKQMVD